VKKEALDQSVCRRLVMIPVEKPSVGEPEHLDFVKQMLVEKRSVVSVARLRHSITHSTAAPRGDSPAIGARPRTYGKSPFDVIISGAM
jgi:hypothetical protein